MKKYLLLIIFLLFNLYLLFGTEEVQNKASKKYKLLICPFICKNNSDEYDYLSKVILEALKTELNKTDRIIFISNKNINTRFSKIFSNKNNSTNIQKLYNIGKLNKIDLIIYGNYEIIDDKIYIKLNLLNTYYEKSESITHEGKTGIDIYRIIDESVVLIIDDVKKIIKKIDKLIKQGTLEINIGGHFSHTLNLYSFILKSEENSKVAGYNPDYFSYFNTPRYVLYGQGISIGIPFSLTYFHKQIFGIGFSINNSFYMLLEALYYPSYFDLINKLYITHKFRNEYKQYSFIIEYGIIFDFEFYNEILYNYNKKSSTYNYYDLFLLNKLSKNLFIGPGIFAGYEKYYDNGFSYTFGGYIDAVFMVNPDYYNEYIIETNKMNASFINIYRSHIRFGIEYRFQFKMLKYF